MKEKDVAFWDLGGMQRVTHHGVLVPGTDILLNFEITFLNFRHFVSIFLKKSIWLILLSQTPWSVLIYLLNTNLLPVNLAFEHLSPNHQSVFQRTFITISPNHIILSDKGYLSFSPLIFFYYYLTHTYTLNHNSLYRQFQTTRLIR